METLQTLTTLVTIVSIVFGILNIILFFKIWGMTDNVKRILNIMEKSFHNDEMDEDAIAEQKSVNILPGLIILAIFVILVGLFLFS